MSVEETGTREKNTTRKGSWGGSSMMILFSATIFVSAALLFLVEPMFAKFVLPSFGGTPAVWTGSMLFFQTALLLSYLYVHLTTSWLGSRRQSIIHLVLVLLPLLVLPLGVPAAEWAPPADSNPIFYLLGLLVVAVGLPFFAVAATNPLIQRWLADTGHPSAQDPYLLYRASNLGSVIGLLGYPIVVERELSLTEQGLAWTAGYVLLIALVFASAVMLWRSAPAPAVAGDNARAGEGPGVNELDPPAPAGVTTASGGGSLRESLSDVTSSSSRLTLLRRARWVGLAFVPSSLMLGVAAFITTDITPIPLLWVIPLSLYLFSFVIVFSPSRRMPELFHKAMVLALPLMMVLIVVTMLTDINMPFWLLILLHLFGFFVAAMVCHGEVARDRPPARHLTEFYLWVAVGGVLGGVFNALIAPVAFSTVVEYPLAIVLACLFVPGVVLARTMRSGRARSNGNGPPGEEEERGPDGERAPRRGMGRLLEPRLLDFVLPAALGVTLMALIWGVAATIADPEEAERLQQILIGIAAALCLWFAYLARRPIRFGLGIAAVLMVGTATASTGALYEDRSFFGVYRITGSDDYHTLVVGNTNHGAQILGPTPPEPITYYHRTGPIGQVFETLPDEVTSRPAVIGLGTGTMACYNRPGQQLTFYEIDPLIERIARDERFFTYLRDCPGEFKVVLGDARLSLAQASDGSYGVIVADAFSSDAIPVHLMTREAVDLYLQKLRSDGVLAMHISNRHLELEPVLGNLAQNAGLACLSQFDARVLNIPDKFQSHWVLISRKEQDLGGLADDSRWQTCSTEPGSDVWTDAYSNLLSTFTWD